MYRKLQVNHRRLFDLNQKFLFLEMMMPIKYETANCNQQQSDSSFWNCNKIVWFLMGENRDLKLLRSSTRYIYSYIFIMIYTIYNLTGSGIIWRQPFTKKGIMKIPINHVYLKLRWCNEKYQRRISQNKIIKIETLKG